MYSIVYCWEYHLYAAWPKCCSPFFGAVVEIYPNRSFNQAFSYMTDIRFLKVCIAVLVLCRLYLATVGLCILFLVTDWTDLYSSIMSASYGRTDESSQMEMILMIHEAIKRLRASAKHKESKETTMWETRKSADVGWWRVSQFSCRWHEALASDSLVTTISQHMVDLQGFPHYSVFYFLQFATFATFIIATTPSKLPSFLTWRLCFNSFSCPYITHPL